MTSESGTPTVPQAPIALKLTQRPVDQELKTSFMDYAMSVIVSRALPDARDGLKPVHRRILYGMNELGITADKPTRKSARIVGDVLGKFHPHGESSVYDSLVRMAQDFSLRYPLVEGQGNFGCFTGDTKIKLLDGRDATFEELSRLPAEQRFYVYAVNKEGTIVVAEGRHARRTKTASDLVEVVLDNGARIRCTPDHRFLLRDRRYKQAADLTPEDSLFAGYFDTAPINEETNDYLRVFQPSAGRFEFVHHLADAYNMVHGDAEDATGPFVRHHINFNRWDNRPSNIVRLGFLEHLHLHALHTKELWQDPEFRRQQRAGVQRFWDQNPDARARAAARMAAQNKDPGFRATNGRKVSRGLRRRYENNPEERKAIADRARALWADPEYRRKMTEILRKAEKRPLFAEEKARVKEIISAKSKQMWADPIMRERITSAIVAALARPETRARLSSQAAENWKKASYRAKYSQDHFQRMAQTLWSAPGTRELHSQKAKKQWEDAAFRQRVIDGATDLGRRRRASHPSLMKDLAQLAALSLAQKWRTTAYRERVLRSKIAGYAHRLLKETRQTTLDAETFDGARPGNWIPRYEKACGYFGGPQGLQAAAESHNHRVVSVTPLSETVDVYDITVDEHHNFLLSAGIFVHNSVDGDGAAASRYTEARLSKVAMEMLVDIEKETVDFVPNYDASLQEPTVLPSSLPNLLVNGSSGIAVGMATNMPPHNLGEVVDAAVHLIDHPDAHLNDLLQHVKGPDFPTGGIIMGRAGILEAFATGRGRIVVRGRVNQEKVRDRQALIITELPYQVNKANLLVAMAELVKDKRVEGISDLRDESSREGMRVIIELKKDANVDVTLNQLYTHTALQQTFGVMNLALVKQKPVIMGLKRLLEEYVEHRVTIVTRRTQYDLRKAEERLHIVEGLLIALEHIDAVVQLIRKAADVDEAKSNLIAKYALTDVQAKAILDMRLSKLAQLEVQTLQDEHAALLKAIARFKEILGSRAEVLTIIKSELGEMKQKYGDARRTEIAESEAGEIVMEELIPEHDIVVTITNAGYVKRTPLAVYRTQGRGGKGIIGTETKEADFVTDLFVTSTHHYIMYFTTRGQVHWLKGYELPEASRYGRGKAVVNLLQGLQPGERVTAAIPVQDFEPGRFVFFATRKGIVKRVELPEFKNVRAGGIRAIGLEEGDELIGVALTRGGQEVVLGKKQGQAVRFNEDDVRPMGRTAVGVWGTRMDGDDEVVALAIVDGTGDLLTIKANGRGKRTPLEEYRLTSRGAQGVITINTEETVDGKTVTSGVVSMLHVHETDEIIVSTEKGIVIRVPVNTIPTKGRGAQGNWIIRPEEGDRVVAVARVANEPAAEGEAAKA